MYLLASARKKHVNKLHAGNGYSKPLRSHDLRVEAFKRGYVTGHDNYQTKFYLKLQEIHLLRYSYTSRRKNVKISIALSFRKIS